MPDFKIPPAIEDFLTELRKAVLPGVWSKGVAAARSGMVELERFGEEEILARVRNADRPVSAKVQLWPEDEDHFCDCNEMADPCSHVAACVAALKGGLVQPKAVAEGPLASAKKGGGLRYSFRELKLPDQQSFLVFERLLDGAPFIGSLVAHVGGIESGRLSGPLPSATREDFRVDGVIAAFVSATPASNPWEQLCRNSGFLERLFSALREVGQVELNGEPVSIGAPTTAIEAVVREEGNGFRVLADSEHVPARLYSNGVIFYKGQLRLLLDPGLTSEERRMLVPPGRLFHGPSVGTLVTEILPVLEKKIPVRILTDRLPRGERTPPRVQFNLESLSEWELSVGLSIESTGPFQIRDSEREKTLLRQIQSELHLMPGHPVRFSGMQAIELVSKLREFQAKNAEETILRGSALERFTVHGDLHLEVSPQRVSLNPGPFEPQFLLADGRKAEAARVLSAYRDGSSLVPLIEGGFATIPKETLARHASALQRLMDLRDPNKRTLPSYALPELAALTEELSSERVGDSAPLVQKLDQFEGIQEAALPADLTAELRRYQKDGVNWLCSLQAAGMGALLADDMGLGKTLQALCTVRTNTLIVAPASVLQGWLDQTRQFRPQLRTNLYWGPQRRLDPEADLTITSYGLLRQDPTLLEHSWDCAILDEAQTIKNPESRVARSAHRMKAATRIALSGTPVENKLEDLWSVFEFLNPGLLGSRRVFQEEWAGPILRGNTDAATRLRRRLGIFVLRRLKREVAPELPPRTEVVLHCDLGDSERDLYQALLAATRKEVIENLDHGASVFNALELLLRLRQAACHPALLPGHQAETSAKLDLLMETLETTLAEGHRALVFSQWTSLLDHIEPRLREAGVRFSRLDGSTADRAAVVSEFQSEDGPAVMLLSLKAGGVGLTLTAADHVFLMDSWWNPAVENQAADRVHRIGQEKPVLICRLVARGTVEERILELQQRKQALAEAVVGSGLGASAMTLTREDLAWLLA